MEEGGRRPGGLTALAVLNFIGSGFDLLGFLSMAFFLWLVTTYAAEAGPTETPPVAEESHAGEPEAESDVAEADGSGEAEREFRKQARELREAGMTVGFLGVAAASSLVLGVLLLLSGIGYLKQKKFLGRVLGSVYAVLSMATIVVQGTMAPELAWNIATMIGAVYPILTLILLNTTFREDFVR